MDTSGKQDAAGAVAVDRILGPSVAASGITEPHASPLGDGRLATQFRAIRPDLTFVAFLLYIFVILTYRLPLGDVGVGLAIVGLMSRKGLSFPPFVRWYAASVLWTFASITWARYPAFDDAMYQVKFFMITVIAVNAIVSAPRSVAFMLFMLLCYITHPIRSGLVNFVRGYTPFGGRLVAANEFANPNQYAMVTMLMLAVAVALLYLVPKSRFVRAVTFGSVLIFPAIIFLTQSRGVFLALIVAAVATMLRSKHPFKIVAAGMVLMVVVAPFVPKGTWDRLGTVTTVFSGSPDNVRDTSAEERLEIARVARMIISDHFPFGVGIGNFRLVHKAYNPALGSKDAHSTYLTLLAELGLAGIVLFLGTVWSVMSTARRALRDSKRHGSGLRQAVGVLEAGMYGALISCIWGTYTTTVFLYLYLATLYCLAAQLQASLRPASAALEGRSTGRRLASRRRW